ncbi:hypothetical protein IP91_02064 [Pseudoduganella lurida]|uniref:DUF5666 domain-containing protein n=1 Tax=Pseudoduganella lurida TaxID=1036180 RepID=A0A562RAZ8_9BURK|nr:hypothetical protein [Pseudoduganella lurida]TWI66252.1 hypothetical protein IP91_02064 [Pseudoduganella lurida]
MKRLLLISLLAACAHTATFAQSGLSNGPRDLSGVVVLGSLVAGSVIVGSSQRVADGVDLVVESVGNASKATVRLSGQAASSLSVAAGTVVDVVATSTGHALVMSGQVLAFVPNEAGKALLHRSKVAE